MEYLVHSEELTGYPASFQRLAAMVFHGVTEIVESGGKLYEDARRDGRWEALKHVGGEAQTIYGVASQDKHCPQGMYRYTLGVKAEPERVAEAMPGVGVFTIQIRASDWVMFALEHFGKQYGHFWQADPYKLIAQLGYDFNTAAGVHIDVYAPSYTSDDDAMEFMMPVKRRP